MRTVKVLELFKGTGSVTKSLQSLKFAKFDIVTLDFDPKFEPDLCIDILKWNYKKAFPTGYFDIIWASPPCTEYSLAKTHGTRNFELADSIVKKTLQVINYFKPKVWFLENPKTGYLKTREFMQGLPYYDVTYCMYGFPYMKPTRIWTNLKGFKPKFCRFDCDQLINGVHKYTVGAKTKRDDKQKTSISLNRRYSIPRNLLNDVMVIAVQMTR